MSARGPCTCVSCESCGGTGTVWYAVDGTYLGDSRCDDCDNMEACDDCGGSGIESECDECQLENDQP